MLHVLGTVVVVAKRLKAEFGLDPCYWPRRVVALQREDVLLSQSLHPGAAAEFELHPVQLLDASIRGVPIPRT